MGILKQDNYKLLEKKFSDESVTTIEFTSGNVLRLNREVEELSLIAKDGSVQLTISVKDNGLVLNLNAVQLNINAESELNISGRKVNIEAKERLSIKTLGNMVQQIGKDNLMEVGATNKLTAQTQKIISTHGNIELKANDDIRLDGERVKLNCD